jgi:hypothetical protein
MPADALRVIRQEIADAGADDAYTSAILARITDQIEAIEAADRALMKMPHGSMADAAAKMAHLFYLSGRGWRRYLGESAFANRTDDLRAAMLASAKVVLDDLAKMLMEREPMRVTQRGGGGYGLPCAACGSDAVTINSTRVSPALADQLVISSLSPVTVFRPMTGPRMKDVVELLEAGVVAAVVQHLRQTQPGGCDAWCEVCDRIYCKSHYAVEAQWTGSWHEATYATCPLGHEHEID